MITRSKTRSNNISKRRRVMEANGLTLLSFAEDCFQLVGTLLTLEDISVACRISKIANRKFRELREKLQHVLMCEKNSSAVLQYCTNLRCIIISQVHANDTLDKAIDVLSFNKKLKRVSFFECDLSELFLESLFGLQHLEDLRIERSPNVKTITRSIHLFRNLSTFRIDTFFMPEFTGVSSIKTLAISSGDVYGPFLSNLPIHFPQLKSISMSFSMFVVRSTMRAFANLQHLQHLTEIDMRFKSFVDISNLQTCKKLKHLSLSCSQACESTDTIIGGLPVIGRFCKQLRSIFSRFRCRHFGEGIVGFLRECTDLQKLGLHCEFPMDIIPLTNITMPNLEELGLDVWDGDWSAILKFAPNLQLLSALCKDVPAVGTNWRLRAIEAQPGARDAHYRYSFGRI